MSRKRTPVRYLSTAEFAERIGVQVDTLRRYNLPEPDAYVGTARGWLEATVDTWHANRPGSGRWGKRATVERRAPRGTNRVAEILNGAGIEVVEVNR